ncbi:hypothetical protein [Streptomyces sp. DH37]|uniref:hypothetical protein n=1 Tax=Streptomyces sp. DH37 TaxID=3040122 RepID=UPI002441FECE|nr:hypothetical protein [Streptomyces sp. DH37]MDG9706252.1 hypothetical protein [Streptomyces sp. DH37]
MTYADEGGGDGGGPFEVRRHGPTHPVGPDGGRLARLRGRRPEAGGRPERDEFGPAVTREGRQEIRLRVPGHVIG